MRHDRNTLWDYLVRDVEDPRINVQSILTRHFLIRQLSGARCDDLMEHELRFSLVMNWLLRLLKKPIRLWQLQAVLDALLVGEDDVEGLKIPPYVSETFATLTLPNYICDLLNWSPDETTDGSIPAYLLPTFQTIWREELDVAIGQICRVTRWGICAGFFNMYEGRRHIVKAIGDYYWNTLSVTETKAAFERCGFVVHVIHMDTFLRLKFGYGDTHNKGAYTFIIHR